MFQEPQSGADVPTPPAASNSSQPRREEVLHMLYGSLAALDRTIKILHVLGYADPNDWTEPMPTERPHEWRRVLKTYLILE